jgi:uncharacterized OsmC-like protein
MTSEIIYKGALRTEAKHLQSQTIIETDAPTDNQGKGECFSPTDLLATSLGSCMLTTMGIKARNLNVDLDGTHVSITKIMRSEPRRVGAIKVEIEFPQEMRADDKQKMILEQTALTCPVAKSIHPDIEVDVHFGWRLLS